MDFKKLSDATRSQHKLSAIEGNEKLLCFDPGHTTGWAYFEGLELKDYGEIDTREVADSVDSIELLILRHEAHAIVVEDYRIYKWRAKHHAGSNLLTARVIGRIETLAYLGCTADLFKQPAHIAKGFCTDAKLKGWGFYRKGSKHARDAIRHGCYFLLFGPIKQSDRIQVGPTVG